MTPVVVAPDAGSDSDGIKAYLTDKAGRGVATRVPAELHKGMAAVAARPALRHYRSDLADEPLRFYLVFRYLIVVRADRPTVEIVRVLHSAQDVRDILGSS